MNLRFYLFVPGVNERNAGGRLVQDFLVLPRGSGASLSLFASEVVHVVFFFFFFFFVFKIFISSVTIYKGNSFYRRLM